MTNNCGACTWGYAPCCDCYLGRGCRNNYEEGEPYDPGSDDRNARIASLETALKLLHAGKVPDPDLFVREVVEEASRPEDVFWNEDWDMEVLS